MASAIARPPAGDTGVAATTFWSYNITAAGGKVATSPALSLDGTKVAFVETGSGAAHFHVLAWKAGDGVDVSQSQCTIRFKAGIDHQRLCHARSGCGHRNCNGPGSCGSASDTLSSPFVDYTNDLAYIGNDSWHAVPRHQCLLHKSGLHGWGDSGAEPGWLLGDRVARSLPACSGKLTGAVVDGGTGNIFVGCSDGKLYGFNSAGASLANSPVTVGNGAATGGIVDPLMIDAVNGFVYVVSGASAGGTSVMVQAKTTDLSSVVTSTLGAGGSHNLHSPAFNSGYFSSVNPTHWLLYEWALNSGGTNIRALRRNVQRRSRHE